MTVDVSNVSSNSDNSDIIAVLGSVDNNVYFVGQFIGFIYIIVCAFWIVYVSCDLFTQIRKGRKLNNLTYFKPNPDFALISWKILSKFMNYARKILNKLNPIYF